MDTVVVEGRARPVVSDDGLPLGPSRAFPLGADALGRDVLTRLLFGARVSLLVSTLGTFVTALSTGGATALMLSAQTLFGASKLVIEGGVHPAVLKDQVTTPAGCTIDGLAALEAGGLRSALMDAVVAAANRSRTLRAEAAQSGGSADSLLPQA